MDSPAPVKLNHGDSHAHVCLHYVGEAKGDHTLLFRDGKKRILPHVFMSWDNLSISGYEIETLAKGG